MSYSHKLKDARWQKIRLQVFERDDWKCKRPGCKESANMILAVHHKEYIAGREPWDYPLDNFLTLCQPCHDKAHSGSMKSKRELKEGEMYRWDELPDLLGFEPKGYLTQIGTTIKCGCFRLDYNPDAPDILLPGDDERVMNQARLFAAQKQAVPIFIKAADGDWEYCGLYRVEAMTTNEVERRIHKERAKDREADVAMVLFLQERTTAVVRGGSRRKLRTD